MRHLLGLAAMLVLMAWLTAIARAEPQLSVIAPVDGETILGTSITVQVDIKDFKLVKSSVPVSAAGQRPDANQPGEGMVHLKLDLFPLVILDQGTSYTFAYIPPGEHQLEIELANNDHSPLSPPVVQIIRFKNVESQAMPRTEGEDVALYLAGGLLIVFFVLANGALLRWCGQITACTDEVCGQLRGLTATRRSSRRDTSGRASGSEGRRESSSF
jgi:hypothetical protein